MRTENRLIVENLSSRVSWQVSDVSQFLFIFGETVSYIPKHGECQKQEDFFIDD